MARITRISEIPTAELWGTRLKICKNANSIRRVKMQGGNSQKYTDVILKSPSRKKIVVGGPGTGKTCLFRKLLEGKKNALTLTFVNSLVEDLSFELYGLCEVRTLHSYAYSILKEAKKGIKIILTPIKVKQFKSVEIVG